jgi:hypothetical protein
MIDSGLIPVRFAVADLSTVDYTPTATDVPDFVFIGTTANLVVKNQSGTGITLTSLLGGQWHRMRVFGIVKVGSPASGVVVGWSK